MTDWHVNKPVAFIIFNRADVAERVFAAIANARPPKLLVVADGPRQDRPGEADKCAATRSIIERVDWDCELATEYSDVNLGCKRRVSTGIDWVFSREEEAIILEDDCLPHPTFFQFSEQLLDRYRDDERIAQIGGSNLQFGRHLAPASYYFSGFTHIWGWATWRRAWRHYDVNLTAWPQVRDGQFLHDVLGNTRQERYWRRVFDRVSAGEIDTWDYQWTFACWMMGALSVVPNVNLISNIGFGQSSSHTRLRSPFASVLSEAMEFPMHHPSLVRKDVAADAFTAREVYKPALPRLLAKVRRDPRGFVQQIREETRKRLHGASSQ